MMPQTDAFSSPITLANLIRQAATRLSGESARREAEMLLEHILKKDRAWLFAHADDIATDSAVASFAELLERRLRGEPLAYLIGHAGFWTLDLKVSPATLIPRPETELLVETALEHLPVNLPVDVPCHMADLGTGSGAIALALASECKQARIVATDASAEALAVAQENARHNGLANVSFHQGDWFAPLQGMRFHLIASNPPYIAEGDPHLSRGDLRFEPPGALSSGPDGLDAIRHLIRHASAHLHPGGWLLLEHGYDQGPAVRELLQQAGFARVSTRQDLEQRDRISLGQWAVYGAGA